MRTCVCIVTWMCLCVCVMTCMCVCHDVCVWVCVISTCTENFRVDLSLSSPSLLLSLSSPFLFLLSPLPPYLPPYVPPYLPPSFPILSGEHIVLQSTVPVAPSHSSLPILQSHGGQVYPAATPQPPQLVGYPSTSHRHSGPVAVATEPVQVYNGSQMVPMDPYYPAATSRSKCLNLKSQLNCLNGSVI